MITDEVRSALRSMYDAGATQQEIAKKAGVTQTHICNLLNGQRKIEGMTLETVEKLFPRARIIMDGESRPPQESLTVDMLQQWTLMERRDKLKVLAFMEQLAEEKNLSASARRA